MSLIKSRECISEKGCAIKIDNPPEMKREEQISRDTDLVGTAVNFWNFWKTLHPILLYILIILLYSELKSVQETIDVVRLEVLNLNIRYLDLELKFMKNFTRLKVEQKNQHDLIHSNELPSIKKHDLYRRSVPKKKAQRSKAKGPMALHLVGAQPELEVRDQGLIAPWIPDVEGLGSFSFPNTTLRDSGSYILVSRPGLYLIYAQIFYLSALQQNSFAITSEEKGGNRHTLALCNANSSGTYSEFGCFTAVVRFMRKGDKLFLIQREKRRLILFRDGQSFFGLVLLQGRGDSTVTS